MVINSRKELYSVLNYERERWKKKPVLSWFGWLKQYLALFFLPGNPYSFMFCLRHLEFYKGRSGGGKLLYCIFYYKFRILQNSTGIDLWPGVAEKGVKINHGKCVVSRASVIGEDSMILSDVTIGGLGGLRDYDGAPKLGKRVVVCSGAKIIGPITIADGVVIGAYAVVLKDIVEPNITVAGIPAKKINESGSGNYIVN